jgi:hypothetical protein
VSGLGVWVGACGWGGWVGVGGRGCVGGCVWAGVGAWVGGCGRAWASGWVPVGACGSQPCAELSQPPGRGGADSGRARALPQAACPSWPWASARQRGSCCRWARRRRRCAGAAPLLPPAWRLPARTCEPRPEPRPEAPRPAPLTARAHASRGAYARAQAPRPLTPRPPALQVHLKELASLPLEARDAGQPFNGYLMIALLQVRCAPRGRELRPPSCCRVAAAAAVWSSCRRRPAAGTCPPARRRARAAGGGSAARAAPARRPRRTCSSG